MATLPAFGLLSEMRLEQRMSLSLHTFVPKLGWKVGVRKDGPVVHWSWLFLHNASTPECILQRDVDVRVYNSVQSGGHAVVLAAQWQ